MLSLLSLLWGVTVLLNAQICCRRRANLWPDPLARPPPPPPASKDGFGQSPIALWMYMQVGCLHRFGVVQSTVAHLTKGNLPKWASCKWYTKYTVLDPRCVCVVV